MIIKSLMAIPKYQVGETYTKGKRLFQIIKVEPINSKVFCYEVINDYINLKETFMFTEKEMLVFKKVEKEKGRVIGSLTKVEQGGHDLHLIEMTDDENYNQMYFTDRQFKFIEKLIGHLDKFHIAKNILIKDKK